MALLDPVVSALSNAGLGTSMAFLVVFGGLLWIGITHIKGSQRWFGMKKKTANFVGWGVTILAVLAVVGVALPGIGTILTAPDGGFGAFSFGDSTDTDEPVYAGSGLVIQTLAVQATEGGSNNAATVDGVLGIFAANADPSSATAQALDSITLNNGIGSSTANIVKEGTKYRVVYTNGTSSQTYYDKDFGVMEFSGLNPNTGVASFDLGDIQRVATLDDILNENSTTGAMNGQTNHLLGTNEIGCAATCTADETFLYDESVGDGSWYIDITPGASGAYGIAQDAVLLFEHDATNPPEGNEYSQITAALRTGVDMGIPSDITSYWQNELPIELGDVKAGTSSTYRVTFTVVEANEDGNDDWVLRFDDLGDYLGKDVRLGVGATADTVTYGGSQA